MSYIGDGVPDSGRFTMDGSGMVQTGPGDSSMLCIFYKRPVHDAVKSANAGRPIYEDQDYVRIQNPGERTQVVDRPTQDNDKRRWPAQWHAYASGKDQIAEGTPLGLLFPRHPSAIAMLQGIGFMTVEQLGAASASAIDAIGMHGQDYVNYAQQYIKGATGGAAFHKMQVELEESKRQNDRLQKQIAQLTEQMQSVNAMMLANAGMGVPMPGGPRAPMMAPAQPQPVAMPRAPSFGNSPLIDAQAVMINANHESKPGRGWPKGKARGPRKAAADAA